MERLVSRRTLLLFLMASFETWFATRFDIEILSSEWLIFTVGICLIALIGGWALPTPVIEKKE